MPPKRTSARTGGQRSQATLSFHNQGPNRVTKPGAAHRHVVSKKDPALLDLTPAIAEPDVNEPTTAEAAIAEQTASVLAQSDPLESSAREADEEDIRASKISDAQVKKYWQAKERERKAPRVHQEGLSMQEKVLREWDMSGQYGPCIGIARLKRWKRANMLGLNPPIEVLAVLVKEANKGNANVQRAHVDELMSSRFIET